MILVNGRNVNFTNFPDGTSSFRFSLEAGTCNISWKYDNDAECMHLLYLVKHLRAMGIDDLYLNMPYIPNARMDRVKNSDEVFTLNWFTDFIKSLNFRLVRVLDPHSNVATALINDVKVMDVKYYINQPIQFMVSQEMNPLLCYPDEGAAKRYSEMIPMEYVFCIKHRDWRTGKIERTELTTPEKVAGRNILIVDDICSRGGTFTYTAKALKAAGAEKILLYVTHCENTILDGTVLTDGLISHVFTTDSILRISHDKITICK